MRIVTGSAKGRPLFTLPGEATRPTGAKVKEAVFSALQFELEGRAFLDLFAGSGQMGLEALSRGAGSAMFIDASREAMDIVKKNAEKTGLFEKSRFLVSDFRNYIRKAAGRDRFHVIYIDPPYKESFARDAVLLILKAGLAHPGALIVTESDKEDIFEGEMPKELSVLKQKRYGISFITIFRYMPD
jgi:16S rRNA (guanine(966)-N(2))-methyltransferase RsmD